jgi:hypothetical protein
MESRANSTALKRITNRNWNAYLSSFCNFHYFGLLFGSGRQVMQSCGDIHIDRRRYWLGLAQRRHCAGIHVQQVREFCEPTVVDGCLGQLYIRDTARRLLLATQMPILLMCPLLFAEQKCGWLRHGPPIAPCARHTGSVWYTKRHLHHHCDRHLR